MKGRLFEMYIVPITLSVNLQSDAAVAESMFRFWQYQYSSAKTKFYAAKSRIESAKQANKDAVKQMQDDDSIGIGSFWQEPFSTERIREYESILEQEQKNFNEAEAMYHYFIKYVFDKLHP